MSVNFQNNRRPRKLRLFALGGIVFAAAMCSHAFAGGDIPERIVSLAPGYDETIIELGLQDKIAGVTDSSDYLAEVRKAARIGSYVKPSIEKIIALKPDIVLAAGFAGQHPVARKLSAIGIRVVVMDDTRGIEEIFAVTRRIGDSLGAQERAGELLRRMETVIRDIRRKTAGLPRPRVYIETGRDPLFTCGRGSFINDMVEITGGKNIAVEINRPFPRISSEFVISRDPEVIILPRMGRNFGKEDLSRRKGWDRVSAVTTGRVYDDLDSYAITIPSPRLILHGLPELLKRIHPELAVKAEPGKNKPRTLAAVPAGRRPGVLILFAR
ncbi:MAG: ABC transporter substrate-binding protein [Kiritimatiellae bacterium]|nr:ABC transporter substrate-binding protein [Kiritimatiellia bacterium]